MVNERRDAAKRLYEVAEGGGSPLLIVSPSSNEVDFHHPFLLPDGRHLITIAHRKAGPNPIVVISLPGGERKDLQSFEALRTVTWSPTGHLLLTFSAIRQQILAVPFSDSKLEISGEPFLVAAGGQFPSVAANGLMIYYLGSSYAQRELAWVDHDGRVEQVIGQPQRGLDAPALSPDGRRVAVSANEKDKADIWIQDLARGTRGRLASGTQYETAPSWAPAGDRIFFQLHANVEPMIMVVPADGSAAARHVTEGRSPGCTPDGHTLVFERPEHGHPALWRLDLETSSAPVLLNLDASHHEDQPRLSPDGRWIAYFSDETGRGDVFIRRFPDGGQKQQVSLNGGTWPFWSRSGDAIYYWERDVLMDVQLKAGDGLTMQAARRLFSAGDVGLVASLDFGLSPAIDIAPDGRFLIVRQSTDDPSNGILVVENWFEEFRK